MAGCSKASFCGKQTLIAPTLRSEPVNHLLTTFVQDHGFEPIITRTFKPPKPDPAGILHIAKEWGIAAEDRARDMIMVGDSIDDMKAGAGAGAMTVLLESDANQHIKDDESTDVCIKRCVGNDHCVSRNKQTDPTGRLDELIDILEHGATNS